MFKIVTKSKSPKAKVVDALEGLLKPKLAIKGLSVFKNHRFSSIMRLIMNESKNVAFGNAAFGNNNSIRHNVTMEVVHESVKEKIKPLSGQPREYVADRKTDFGKAGFASNDEERDHSMLASDYNFDVCVTNNKTKKIVAIVEVVQLYDDESYNRNVEKKLRAKLKDCLDHIDGLEHAYVVKVPYDNNGALKFCKFVKAGGMSVKGIEEKDGLYELPVREIFGVQTSLIEQRVKAELESRL